MIPDTIAQQSIKNGSEINRNVYETNNRTLLSAQRMPINGDSFHSWLGTQYSKIRFLQINITDNCNKIPVEFLFKA